MVAKLRNLANESEGIMKEWSFSRLVVTSISSAVDKWQKWLRVAWDRGKRTPRWYQDVKQTIRAKKDVFHQSLIAVCSKGATRRGFEG